MDIASIECYLKETVQKSQPEQLEQTKYKLKYHNPDRQIIQRNIKL